MSSHSSSYEKFQVYKYFADYLTNINIVIKDDNICSDGRDVCIEQRKYICDKLILNYHQSYFFKNLWYNKKCNQL